MNSQHLSDEAVAACADGVLAGRARDRASRHIADCAECAYAVAVQREAAWALRGAVAPSLPTGLLDRLHSVPMTTPITTPAAVVAPDGSTMLSALAPIAALAAARRAAPGSADRDADRDDIDPYDIGIHTVGLPAQSTSGGPTFGSPRP